MAMVAMVGVAVGPSQEDREVVRVVVAWAEVASGGQAVRATGASGCSVLLVVHLDRAGSWA